MPPECYAQGKGVPSWEVAAREGDRVDSFALGCIWYEMLTGMAPDDALEAELSEATAEDEGATATGEEPSVGTEAQSQAASQPGAGTDSTTDSMPSGEALMSVSGPA